MVASSRYEHSEVEKKWYQYWLDNDYFSAYPNPKKEPYTIVMPPPNVTGVLHMGHMLNNTIQDVLIRKARMEGKEACWVPGTDHASIATEAKVVQFLRSEGIKKSDLSREEFMQHAWEWKKKYGGIILQQLKHIGASCDWNRTTFTMDDHYHKTVIKAFIDLYNKGYIYRSLRMTNWDCKAKTTISNEEVIYKEEGEKAILYTIKYRLEHQEDYISIATLRPETIMGDTAIAVHPSDKRYQHLIGKKAIVPLVNRAIPIIGDHYVKQDFGTGCLKVTPAHDINDYEIGVKHQLNTIDVINDDGTISEACGIEKYVGKDRFEVRKMAVKDLEDLDILVEKKELITKIGRSERTHSVIEPKLSLQWFVNMKEISKKAHQVVMDDEIRLYPSKYKNTYHHWMSNVKDWCISRQLWWGQRIPAFFYGHGDDDFVVAENMAEAVRLAQKKTNDKTLTQEHLRQEEDVLDTWASSNLWPIAVFKGFEEGVFDEKEGKIIKKNSKELDYFYPTDTLVTAPEILFFWVARMIICGYEYLGEKPFKNVYLTGIVRDKQKRKMSKSLGNSPDPLALINQYSADGVRTGMLFSSPAGNDLLFDEKLCEQGRNFCNKIWNAFRLIDSWEIANIETPTENKKGIEWFDACLNKAMLEIEDHYLKFRISDALMTLYKLVWDDFCSWFLEIIKPTYQQPIDRWTHKKCISFFEQLLKLLHPFTPFITEEIWQQLQPRKTREEAIIITAYPVTKSYENDLILAGETMISLVTQIRQIRNKQNIPSKNRIALHTLACHELVDIVQKLGNLSGVVNATPVDTLNTTAFVLKSHKYYLVSEAPVDPEEEQQKIQKELAYANGFKASIEKKLGNKKFVDNAPQQVIGIERKKLSDIAEKIKALTERYNEIKKI